MALEAGLLIRFVDADAAESNKLAGDLSDALGDDVPHISLQRLRDQEMSQDFGAVISVILGSAAINSLAKGLSKWLNRNSEASIELERTLPTGEVIKIVIKGRPAPELEGIIENFLAS